MNVNDRAAQFWSSLAAYSLSQPQVFMYAIKSARSLSFFRPANTILVPGIYFFGFTRYSNMCFSDQTIPEVLLASEYGNPSSVPEWRPMMPQRFGPCLLLPPLSMVWH